MQNKKTIIILSIVVIVVSAAAFIGGKMLNGQVGPLGLGIPLGGNGDVMSVAVQMTPAPELPTTQPEALGSFVERKDNAIFIQPFSMAAGQGGVIEFSSSSSEGGESVSDSPADNGEPKVEVIINNETIIYLDTTPAPELNSGEEQVIQQTVGEGSLDDLASQAFVTVWGRKSGDRIIAEVVLISNPVMIQKPGP